MLYDKHRIKRIVKCKMQKTASKDILTAARSAFPHTIPILTGFGFLGMTYGIYMKVLCNEHRVRQLQTEIK